MRLRPGQRGVILSLVALLALAATGLGFAHRPPRTAADRPYDIAAYTLPDGTAPVLCLAGDGSAPARGDESSHRGVICDACLIPQAAIVVGPCAHIVAQDDISFRRPLRPWSGERPSQRHYANAARSPPLRISSSA